MAARRSNASIARDVSPGDPKAGAHVESDMEKSHAGVPGEDLEFKHDLHRGLKARHITMIAIGGAIGTGLIIGT